MALPTGSSRPESPAVTHEQEEESSSSQQSQSLSDALTPEIHPNTLDVHAPTVHPMPSARIKLPVMSIQSFSGDPMQWPGFWDLFDAAVQSQRIAPVEKFVYLKSLLTGDATRAISGLSITNSNYQVAVDILQSRFGDISLIQESLYRQLRGLRYKGDVRIFLDSVECVLRQLEGMGANINEISLLHSLVEKVPRHILVEMERLRPANEEWTMASWRRCIKDITQRQERVNRLQGQQGREYEVQDHTRSTSGQVRRPNQFSQQSRRSVPRLNHFNNQRYNGPPNNFGQGNGHQQFNNSRVNSALIQSRTRNTGPPSQRLTSSRAVPGESGVTGQRISPPYAEQPQFSQSHVPLNGQHFSKYPSYSLRGIGESQGEHQTRLCIFCKGNGHFNDQCLKFKTVKERRDVLNQDERCYICLRRGHMLRQCTDMKPCFHCGAQRKHNRALCPGRGAQTTDVKQMYFNRSGQHENNEYKQETGCFEPVRQEINTPTLLTASCGTTQKNIRFLTAAATVVDNQGSERGTINVFLDSGGETTFIKSSVAERLQLKSEGREIICIDTFGNTEQIVVSSNIVRLTLKLRDGGTMQIRANTLERLTSDVRHTRLCEQDIEAISQSTIGTLAWPLHEEKSSNPDLLIGCDHIWDLIGVGQQKLPSGLYVIPSKIGTMVSGKEVLNLQPKKMNTMTVKQIKGQELTKPQSLLSIDDFADIYEEKIPHLWWSLEAIVIHDDPTQQDDEVALNQFNTTIEFKNGRYTVDFPWKGTESKLPSNFGLALGRLKNLVTNKLRLDDDLMHRYDEVIKDQLKKGVIEMVTADSEEGPVKHYLAHHAVITPTKTTTKIRLVYDASARINKKHLSLNDVIHQGPLMLPNLIGLILRFRQRPVGIVGDLEKAFLQISLHVKARDATRFLWLRDPYDKAKSVQDNIQVYRFTRVPFGVNASPFLLSATVEKHINDTNTDIAHIIKDNVYVDNVILSMDTETQAFELYTEGKKIFHAANMNLREWLSNSKTVMSGIPQEDHANSTTAKILGMPWDSEADTMSFQTPEVPKQLMTKRKAVKFISSLYDPLGLLVPMTLEGKLLIQSLWKLKLAWDDELPDIKKSEFHSLISNYISVSNIQIPRCAAPFGVVKSQQLHTFVDASQYAYACCSYLRTENADGSIKCTLLFAKNRLAPSNTAITIPKMETLALLIGTRAQVVLEKEMRIPLDKRIIWSDSQCVLHWLTSTHRLPVFIENRMKEIRKHSNKTSFRYVKSEENPADYATKNGNGQVLDTNSTWWNGPVWLQLDEKSWPVWKYDITHQFTTMENEVCSESETVCPSTLQVATVRVVESTNSQFPLKIERFSSLTKLHRVTALVLRYLDRRIWSRLSKATRDSHAGLQTILRHSFTKGPVQALELKKAELILIKTVQHASYEQELAVIHFGSADTKLLKNLNIKIDNDGIMRSEGRLAHSRQIHWKTNSPILLPTHHSYTNLMIKHVHPETPICITCSISCTLSAAPCSVT